MAEYRLEMKGICKSFPGVKALDGINLRVRPLEKFSESAREIATGRFDVTLPLVRSNDEIKDLYDSILQFLCVVMTEFLLMVSG